MDNYYYILFAIFIIIIILILIVIIYNNTSVIILGSDTGTIKSNHCIIATETLPNLSFNQCCTIFGSTTNTKYLSTLNLVVSPVAINYVDVCSGFCTGAFDKPNLKCLPGTNVINLEEEQLQLDRCIIASQPINCSDLSNPVAVSNTSYLYPYSAGTQLCLTSGICGLNI